MRHLKTGRRLNRTPSHRWAMLRNMVTALLRHERIETTDPKAKELRRWADRVISLGKQGSLHARRRALSIVRDKAVVRKLFDTLAPRFKDRPGGYTRIVKVGWRRGDRAPLSVIELMPETAPAKADAPSGRQRRGRKTTPRKSAAAKKTSTRQSAKEPSA